MKALNAARTPPLSYFPLFFAQTLGPARLRGIQQQTQQSIRCGMAQIVMVLPWICELVQIVHLWTVCVCFYVWTFTEGKQERKESFFNKRNIRAGCNLQSITHTEKTGHEISHGVIHVWGHAVEIHSITQSRSPVLSLLQVWSVLTLAAIQTTFSGDCRSTTKGGQLPNSIRVRYRVLWEIVPAFAPSALSAPPCESGYH